MNKNQEDCIKKYCQGIVSFSEDEIDVAMNEFADEEVA